jgi:hypothetical protein
VLDQVVGVVSFSANFPFKLQTVPHTPALHTGVPPFAGHAMPHAPQLVNVSSGVSQPFRRLVSQSPNWLEHVGTHSEPLQLVVPCAFMQPRSQAPQCSVVLASAVSQPLLGCSSQSPKLAAQLSTRHSPPVHRALPFAIVHILPQKPQWSSAVWVSVSQPTAASPSHSPNPALHGEISQAPPTQICDAKLHVFVHVPQWRGSLSVFASQPLFGSPSQSVCVAAQVGEHTPALQLVVP